MTGIGLPPETYAQWSKCLDLLEEGLDDAGVVSAMEHGRLGWTSGVANLFSDRISAVFNVRLQRCNDQMTRELRAGGGETTLVRALLNSRRTLALLHRVATLPAFPALLRDHLCQELKSYATRSQQALEDSAALDRSGRTASLIRNNSILRYDASDAVTGQAASTSTSTTTPHPGSNGVPGRRRNILI
ncbi:hypothetical protein [Noviherbaspirillum pedocola]|uniref:Uncharacterized protein n=1 Tax=Noviherbaspirillum pedocola TaxID=2801341 RepID=A0A934SU63_9BURK|nr:hypothetical protein [Noviherbaspirillum pedocola]MBK4735246.1 hypothetical protein [Noviherbaspirillum pedocola]